MWTVAAAVLTLVFLLSCVFPLLLQGPGVNSNITQVAFPGRNSSVSSVFVDSGAYPQGIYRERHAFGDDLDFTVRSRICGLFSSSAPAGAGTVSLWFPVVHREHGVKWRHAYIRHQLYSPRASQSLFSTHVAEHQLNAVPILTRHAHCMVFSDGWVAPFPHRTDGIFLDVVFAPADEPPDVSALPSHCLYRPVFGDCASVVPRLLGPLLGALPPMDDNVGAIAPQIPRLTLTELQVWRLMGFPFNRQWRWAFDATLDHGLAKVPAPVHMFTDLHVLPSRMRALPFARIHTPRSKDVIGALIHMDFHTGLPASRPHAFLHHCSIQDDASRFGRMYPTSRMHAQEALDCLARFQADLQRETKRQVVFIEVLADNVPFDSEAFRSGCAEWKTGPIKVTTTGFYAHAQAGRIERYHGVRMATGRVLQRYALIPGSWWPYATNHSNVLHNMLPHSADHGRSPLALLRGVDKVSWKTERIHIFGHLAMVWLAPPQRGETAKQLADRARPGIYLGKCSDSLDSHFFMIDSQEFHRASHYKVDNDRPPPGWPLRSTHEARTNDVLAEMLSLPDTLDVGSYLLDELPLPGSTLPDFAEQEGDATVVPEKLLNHLPNVEITPINLPPTPTKAGKDDKFELTPIRSGFHPAPLDPQFMEPEDRPGSPDPAPFGDVLGDENAPVDPLTQPRVIPNHGTDTHYHPDHCSNTDCVFPRGHNGPCSHMLPDAGQSHEGRPSANLRPRNRANFTKQESANFRSLLFQSVFLAAASTTQTVNGANVKVGYIPATFFASAYDNTTFVSTPDQTQAASIPIPRGVKQALESAHAEFWLEAIFKEYHSILSHDVFTVVRRCSLPGGTNVMRCHCIFTVKPNKDGSIERYKCRLVADGNTQVHGVDFTDIFSTVVKFSSLRMALHLAAVRGYNITAIDISTAFLYGEIDVTNAYMEMPEGLPRYDAEGYELVCHLHKSIYGLRQAPRIWFQHFKKSLEAFGFSQSKVDPCLFIFEDGSTTMYGLLWVDDLILITDDDVTRAKLIDFLKTSRNYTLTDKGDADWLLGIALSRDRVNHTITLSQSLYVKNVLQRFGPYLDSSNARNFDVPAMSELSEFNASQCPTEGSEEYRRMAAHRHVYMQMIGALIWLSSCTLPHLCVATNILSRFSISPSEKQFAALLRVFLYLQKHPDETLTLGGTGPNAEVIQIITDASHEDGPSLSGVLVIMGTVLINWICRRQKSTSRSSLESEALANAEGAQDGVYQRELGKEFGVAVTTTDFWTDSDSSVKLHKDQYACKRSKHIIRVITMLREWILNRVYNIKFIPGSKNYADLLTKPLGVDSFRRFRDALLSGNVVPATNRADFVVSYVGRLTQYLLYAHSLPESPDAEEID